jgi:hypothetical protein
VHQEIGELCYHALSRLFRLLDIFPNLLRVFLVWLTVEWLLVDIWSSFAVIYCMHEQLLSSKEKWWVNLTVLNQADQ